MQMDPWPASPCERERLLLKVHELLLQLLTDPEAKRSWNVLLRRFGTLGG